MKRESMVEMLALMLEAKDSFDRLLGPEPEGPAQRSVDLCQWAVEARALLEELRRLLEQGDSVSVELYERIERALS